jgi:hypothetical protein
MAKPLRLAIHVEVPFAVLSCLVKELGADVNQKDEDGWTVLAVAAALGNHDTVLYLAEELRADVNTQADLGVTPVCTAALWGQLDMVRTMLKAGADIERSRNNGVTPLIVASVEKHQEIVKWLIKAGADTQALYNNHPNATAAAFSRDCGASTEQTEYLEAKTHCSDAGCSGAGVMKCTGCKQARYCGEVCQLLHWKAHKADCRRWSAELAAGKGH